MLEVVYHPRFLKSVKLLPRERREKIPALIGLLRADPFGPHLHTKRLSEPLSGIFSFRISRDWRILFRFVDVRTIQLLRAQHRKDVYR